MEVRKRRARWPIWRVSAVLLGMAACGEREAPAPPAAQPALTPVPAESVPVRRDTLEGDSVMARDTLWSPIP